MRLREWSFRLRIIGLGSLLSYGLFSQIPDPTEANVRDALSRAIGAGLTVEDYVWLPSAGRVDDGLDGRDVVFLARSEAGHVAAYRAKVLLTFGGRPLRASAVKELLPTPLANTTQLHAQGARYAFALEHDGKVQSIVLGQQGDSVRLHALALDRPREKAQLQFSSKVLRVVSGNTGFDVDVDAPEHAGFQSISNAPQVVVERAFERGTPSPQTKFEGLEPRTSFGGEHPAVVGRELEGRSLLMIDGRQTTFALSPGWGASTTTGFRPTGVLEPLDGRAAPIVALALPGLRGGGLAQGSLLSNVDEAAPGLYSTAGSLFFGTWQSTKVHTTPLDAFIPIAGPGGDTSMTTSLCATVDGHLAIGWAPTSDASRAALPPSCAVIVDLPGPARMLEDAAGAAAHPHEETLLYVFGREVGPALGGRHDLSFEPFPESAAAPTFIPSVFRARTEALGATVTVHHVDVTRFDFKIVVGSTERSHRLGGKFEVGLPPALRHAFRFQLPLGVGERMRTRGLRSLGKLGHEFSLNEGLLEVGDGSVRVSTGREQSACLDAASPCTSDATELPLSVNDGSPTDASRHRGPLQSRADLCVQGGQMLVAVSDFDTHEANAAVLALLGCSRAVMLDRGSEHPSRWAGSEQPGELTALVAFERTLSGRIAVANVPP